MNNVCLRLFQVALEFGGYIGYATARLGNLLPSSSRIISVEASPRLADTQRAVLDHAGMQRVELVSIVFQGFEFAFSVRQLVHE